MAVVNQVGLVQYSDWIFVGKSASVLTPLDAPLGLNK